jgi:hypothetical protein
MRFMLAVNLSLETSRLQAQPVKLAIRYTYLANPLWEHKNLLCVCPPFRNPGLVIFGHTRPFLGVQRGARSCQQSPFAKRTPQEC